MEELKPCPQEAEALDIIESLLDVADMKCTGPLYADAPPRSGMCRIPEDDAIKLRQYIADRRAAPENPRRKSGTESAENGSAPASVGGGNKPLTLEQLRKMKGQPVYCIGQTRFDVHFDGWKVVTKNNSMVNVIRFTDGTDFPVDVYGKRLLAYARRPEGSEING